MELCYIGFKLFLLLIAIARNSYSVQAPGLHRLRAGLSSVPGEIYTAIQDNCKSYSAIRRPLGDGLDHPRTHSLPSPPNRRARRATEEEKLTSNCRCYVKRFPAIAPCPEVRLLAPGLGPSAPRCTGASRCARLRVLQRNPQIAHNII